jgi:hypothetical protein
MYPDAAGLYWQVTATSAKCWVYRFTPYGRAREMGIGSFNVYSLVEAREKAAVARKLKSHQISTRHYFVTQLLRANHY